METTRVCSVEGCGRGGQLRRGMCDNCYRKARRKGMPTLPRVVRICKIDGCGAGARAHGMCPVHYGRVRHHGDPNEPPRQQASDVWDRVVETSDGCLEWQGAKSAGGYGQMWVDGRLQYTHRLAWEAAFGPIPDGMLVCHHCDNPPCCNPNHYFIGTHADNHADKISKGRHLKRRDDS